MERLCLPGVSSGVRAFVVVDIWKVYGQFELKGRPEPVLYR